MCGYTSALDSVFLNPTINNSALPSYSNKVATEGGVSTSVFISVRDCPVPNVSSCLSSCAES